MYASATDIATYASAASTGTLSANLAIWATVALGAVSVIITIVVTYRTFTSQRKLSASYERELAVDIAAQKTEAGRDTYKILAKYSAQGLAQSRTSFIVSIFFAALGFVVILGGVGIALYSGKQASIAAIPVIAGAIVDAVAALFFTVNARTQRVMVEFFDKLRSDQRVEDAMEIASKLPDAVMASRLQALLALNFTGAENIPDLFRQLIDTGSHPSNNT